MRRFISLFLLALLSLVQSVAAAELPFYIGTFTDGDPDRGIYRCTLNTETGALGAVTLAAEAEDPSYIALSPDGKHLYSANRGKEPTLAAYRIEPDGSLTLLNKQPISGKSACHISVDPSGKVAFIANYSSGDIASYPINEDGSVGERASFIQFEGSGPHPRQKGPRAHAVQASPDGRHLYVCDLGTDKVWIFEINTADGSLTTAKTAFASVPPGGGPRHLVLSQSGQHLWVNNELDLSVTAFTRDPGTGALTPIATVPMHQDPPDSDKTVTAAAIRLHPNEKFLYVTSRGDDGLSVYTIAEDGSPTLFGRFPAGVERPREANIDPTGQWLLVAGQNDDTLVVMAIDSETGHLSPTKHSVQLPKPVCIAF